VYIPGIYYTIYGKLRVDLWRRALVSPEAGLLHRQPEI